MLKTAIAIVGLFVLGVVLRLLASRIGMGHWHSFAETGHADWTGHLADILETVPRGCLWLAWIVLAGLVLVVAC